MIWVTWARIVGFDVSLDQNRERSTPRAHRESANMSPVLITTSLFWNMLEVSLGIIATCLPTLRGLTRKRSVDSLVNSIRDKMSLRSGQLSDKSDDHVQLNDFSREGSRRDVDFITAADA